MDISIPAATRERVLEAASRLHYRPNNLARSLRTRSTKTIGVAICRPTKIIDPRYSYSDRLFTGLDLAADEAQFFQLHYPACVRYGDSLDPFLDGRVDGILIDSTDRRTLDIAKAGMPIVVVGRGLDVPEGCGGVWANEVDTANLALTHLWELGHRRIAHLAGPCGDDPQLVNDSYERSPALLRRLAYSDWMSSHGVDDPALIASVPTWFRAESTEACVAAVGRWLTLPAPPTAIFCANDSLALIVIEAITSRGLNVPSDISVVGVDNTIEAMLSKPTLTTVEVPGDQIGTQAVRVLLKLIAGAKAEECREVIPVTELNVRDSTAPAR